MLVINRIDRAMTKQRRIERDLAALITPIIFVNLDDTAQAYVAVATEHDYLPAATRDLALAVLLTRSPNYLRHVGP